jgi:hypothetical protein
LFVLFPVYLCLFVHLSPFISLGSFVVVSFIIVNELLLNYTQTRERNSTHTLLAKNPIQSQIKSRKRKQVIEITN